MNQKFNLKRRKRNTGIRRPIFNSNRSILKRNSNNAIVNFNDSHLKPKHFKHAKRLLQPLQLANLNDKNYSKRSLYFCRASSTLSFWFNDRKNFKKVYFPSCQSKLFLVLFSSSSPTVDVNPETLFGKFQSLCDLC
jgi:hypothetical protein